MAPWLPRAVAPVDVSVALLMGLAMSVVVGLFPNDPGTLAGLGDTGLHLLTLVLTVVLVLRRAAPVATTLVVAALTVAYPGNWFVFAAVYAAGAYARPRTWLWLLVPVSVAASFVGERGWVDLRPNDHAFVAFAATLFALAGLYVGTRRTLIAAATERADRAERERELLAEQARAEERTRLAAEMHDVVTHRVNLMVLQAGALGARSGDTAVREAAEAVRASGVAALAELRDLVGVLRAGADPVAVTGEEPASDEVAVLVGESRSVGVDVVLTERGDPGALAPTVRRALLRVVQESLTNARKHAPGSRVTVRLVYDEQGATVAVVDDGPDPVTADPGASAMAAAGGGTGLEGLRSRVAMVGGTLEAGPGADGGFAVRAAVPAFVPTAAPATTSPRPREATA